VNGGGEGAIMAGRVWKWTLGVMSTPQKATRKKRSLPLDLSPWGDRKAMGPFSYLPRGTGALLPKLGEGDQRSFRSGGRRLTQDKGGKLTGQQRGAEMQGPVPELVKRDSGRPGGKKLGGDQ